MRQRRVLDIVPQVSLLGFPREQSVKHHIVLTPVGNEDAAAAVVAVVVVVVDVVVAALPAAYPSTALPMSSNEYNTGIGFRQRERDGVGEK